MFSIYKREEAVDGPPGPHHSATRAQAPASAGLFCLAGDLPTSAEEAAGAGFGGYPQNHPHAHRMVITPYTMQVQEFLLEGRETVLAATHATEMRAPEIWHMYVIRSVLSSMLDILDRQ